MKTKFEIREERLAARVQHAIGVLGYQEFCSRNIAKVLGADKYDVLHSLHQLRNAGVVEQVRRCDDIIFIDRWRVARPAVSYNPAPVAVQPVCEAL